LFITSHQETDAGLDRPLYLRNKLYDKTVKSQNYYSNILRFTLGARSDAASGYQSAAVATWNSWCNSEFTETTTVLKIMMV